MRPRGLPGPSSPAGWRRAGHCLTEQPSLWPRGASPHGAARHPGARLQSCRCCGGLFAAGCPPVDP
eukprot:10669706-Lingulodinium_polyedra.AAC.1